PPTSTLFPYTTLFRSVQPRPRRLHLLRPRGALGAPHAPLPHARERTGRPHHLQRPRPPAARRRARLGRELQRQQPHVRGPVPRRHDLPAPLRAGAVRRRPGRRMTRYADPPYRPAGVFDPAPAYPLEPGQVSRDLAALARLLAERRVVVVDGYVGVLWDE